MKTFYRKVDIRSKKAMIDFLSNHFRYNTMNSWNNSTSYANNVKVHNLGLTREQEDKAYELLDVEDSFYPINDVIADFDADHDYTWQVGSNGRSGGYLVLYRGGKELSEHKSRCYDHFSYPGKNVDQGEDFTEWTMDDLRDRVKLVQEFDKLTDDCLAELISLIEDYEVEEETICIPKTIKVLKEKTA